MQVEIQNITTFIIGGLLFSFLGAYGLISMLYIYYIKNKEEALVKETTQITNGKIAPINPKKEALIVPKKICSRCGEEYPEDTIHSNCILCGTPL